MNVTVTPGLRQGTVTVPASKSHLHRLLIAEFLAGNLNCLEPDENDADDIIATKRCLKAMATNDPQPILDCGESGSTRRFLAPIAAALGKLPRFLTAGRLASRPMLEYPTLKAGLHELEGNVSSQFVTGLLFALPLLKSDSEIRFKSPLQSAGYVEMTLQTLEDAGIAIERLPTGFKIRGSQNYRTQTNLQPEGDWSAAAFWVVANALGNEIRINGVDPNSRQPDRAIVELSAKLTSAEGECEIDVAQCPDIFPILAVQAAARQGHTRFTSTRRLRLKESDRTESTATMLRQWGAQVENLENEFLVDGTGGRFHGGEFSAFGDHRLAMATAIGATIADSCVTIIGADCVRKSYPRFFEDATVRLGISRKSQLTFPQLRLSPHSASAACHPSSAALLRGLRVRSRP